MLTTTQFQKGIVIENFFSVIKYKEKSFLEESTSINPMTTIGNQRNHLIR
jgi:hypothetical protein